MGLSPVFWMVLSDAGEPEPPPDSAPGGGATIPAAETGVLWALAYAYEPANSSTFSGYLPGSPPTGPELPNATYPVNSGGTTYIYTGPFSGFSLLLSTRWPSGFPNDFYRIYRMGVSSIPWSVSPTHIQQKITALINGGFTAPDAVSFRVSWEWISSSGTVTGVYNLSR